MTTDIGGIVAVVIFSIGLIFALGYMLGHAHGALDEIAKERADERPTKAPE